MGGPFPEHPIAVPFELFRLETERGSMDRARAAGSLKRFSQGCSVSIPDRREGMFSGLDDAPDMGAMVAASPASEQCRRFATEGVVGYHIYTQNKPDVSLSVCRALPARMSANLAA